MGVHHPVPDGGTPPRLDEGMPVRIVPHQPSDLDGDTPVGTEWGYPLPSGPGWEYLWDLVGVHPHLRLDGTWTGYATGGMPLVVSCRRTFLDIAGSLESAIS